MGLGELRRAALTRAENFPTCSSYSQNFSPGQEWEFPPQLWDEGRVARVFPHWKWESVKEEARTP